MKRLSSLAVGLVALGLVFWALIDWTVESEVPHEDPKTEVAVSAAQTPQGQISDQKITEEVEGADFVETAPDYDRLGSARYEHIAGTTGSYFRLSSSSVGQVDLLALAEGETLPIKHLLSDYNDFLGDVDDLSFEVLNVRDEGEQVIVDFRQTIEGIPVDRNLRMLVEPGGQVTWLSAVVFSPDAVLFPQVQLSEATVHAQTALPIEFVDSQATAVVQSAIPGTNVTDPHLVYTFDDLDSVLSPQWNIFLASSEPGQIFVARVDATTGKTTIEDTILRNFEVRVCQSPTALSCSTGAPVVFEENSSGERVCVGSASACSDSTNITPWEVMDNLEKVLERDAPGQCCDAVGGADGIVDIVTNGTIFPGPVYSTASDSIIIPDSSLPTPPGVVPGHDWSQDHDALSHEGAHAVICVVNPSICSSSGDESAVVVAEGMADSLAAIYSEEYGSSGDPWVIGEEAFPGNARDLNEARQFSELHDSSGSPHVRGQVYGNFFRKLRDKGIQPKFVARMILETLARLDKTGGSSTSEYDEEDFSQAAIEAAEAIGSVSLEAKVEEALNELAGGTTGSGDDDDDYVCEDCEDVNPDPYEPPPEEEEEEPVCDDCEW